MWKTFWLSRPSLIFKL
ncbi:hypothetical protein DVH24_026331 [Malus domestica]|uniref:Uncharacterized protein n=1 Tax=Malus domestica TaxID=3750 RepID=A0A498KNC6_MALDO|nr:hypothetical protein DVH24_026331 [Malus domestica]